MNPLRKWSTGFALTTTGVIVSYQWFDRPIAIFVHSQLQGYDVFAKLTYIPEILAPLVLLAFAAIALHALLGRKLAKFETVLVLVGASLALGDAVKDKLKFAFGRTWPETRIRDNPSFIRDGAFGFNPFHGGPGYAAFPSGHTMAICAAMTVLWLCYPRFRAVYAIAMAAVAVGLVGADFHFIGDVIAGGFLGVSVGWFTVVIWELGYTTCVPTSRRRSQRVQKTKKPRQSRG